MFGNSVFGQIISKIDGNGPFCPLNVGWLNNPFPEEKKSYHTTPLQIAKESRHQNAQIDVATIYSLHILDMHIYTAIAIINYMPKEKEKGTGTYTLSPFQNFHFTVKKKKTIIIINIGSVASEA